MPAEQRLLNKLVTGEIGFWISSMLKAEETPVLSRDKTVIRCVSAVKSEKGARCQVWCTNSNEIGPRIYQTCGRHHIRRAKEGRRRKRGGSQSKVALSANAASMKARRKRAEEESLAVPSRCTGLLLLSFLIWLIDGLNDY